MYLFQVDLLVNLNKFHLISSPRRLNIYFSSCRHQIPSSGRPVKSEFVQLSVWVLISIYLFSYYEFRTWQIESALLWIIFLIYFRHLGAYSALLFQKPVASPIKLFIFMSTFIGELLYIPCFINSYLCYFFVCRSDSRLRKLVDSHIKSTARVHAFRWTFRLSLIIHGWFWQDMSCLFPIFCLFQREDGDALQSSSSEESELIAATLVDDEDHRLVLIFIFFKF